MLRGRVFRLHNFSSALVSDTLDQGNSCCLFVVGSSERLSWSKTRGRRLYNVSFTSGHFLLTHLRHIEQKHLFQIMVYKWEVKMGILWFVIDEDVELIFPIRRGRVWDTCVWGGVCEHSGKFPLLLWWTAGEETGPRFQELWGDHTQTQTDL